MQPDSDLPFRPPMIRLLHVAAHKFDEELAGKLGEVGLGDLRPGHGCVFGNIDPEGGSRLTELAERANMTKQSVGEFASELEKLGYIERVPDPNDGRAKIIRLTDQGRRAYWIGRRLIDELECEWGQRYGQERIVGLREGLEVLTADGLGVTVDRSLPRHGADRRLPTRADRTRRAD